MNHCKNLAFNNVLLSMKFMRKLILMVLLLASSSFAFATIPFPGKQPGLAKIAVNQTEIVLGNDLLLAKYTLKNGKLSLAQLNSGDHKILTNGGELFVLKMKDGTLLPASQMTMSKPVVKKVNPSKKAMKASLKNAGKAIVAQFISPDKKIKVQWRAILRDHSSYLRQEMQITANQEMEIGEIIAMQYVPVKGQNIKVSGNTDGSLLVGDNAFFALETPAAINGLKTNDSQELIEGRWIRRAPLKRGDTWSVSSVVGIMSQGQERRSFLSYLERERAVPHRSFIHYNSWYELNINRNDDLDPMKRMTESQTVEVVKAWNDKLSQKRGMNIDAFVWDDGWDEFNSLWEFHKGFPNGFKKSDALARKQKAGIGAWLGPVGGYSGSKAARLNNWNVKHPGQKIGNFELANKEYFDAFSGRCLQMVRDYDMRYFKFDGISPNTDAIGPAANREEDVEGILQLIQILRKGRSDLFFNCTVGTWASPFWYMFADSIWRQGSDHGTIGEGNNREKWITYRDWKVYNVFVKSSPLFPINSLMTHGLMISKCGPPSSMPNEIEPIKHEMRCAFGCGSGLQELYIDHALMTTTGTKEVLWDELAQSIKWYRKQIDIMADTHWVGGAPWNENTKVAEIYGWASWSPSRSVLTLRNPSQNAKEFTTTLRHALDIPAEVKGKLILKNAYNDQRVLDGITNIPVDIDEEICFKLNPFDVFVFDGSPS